MNSGEICHHAKIFMGAGEGKIAEMIQQEQEQARQEQARQEQSRQEQARAGAGQTGHGMGPPGKNGPIKNGSEYQTTKCSAYQVEYKCITIVSGVERTGESADEFHIRALVGEETEYQDEWKN